MISTENFKCPGSATHNLWLALVLAITVAAPTATHAQQCASGQINTREAYQYGRFETRMQSAQGNGIVSSFFLYNLDLNCNWPAENNEIDVEMTGNRASSVQFTTHYPGPWSATQIVPTPFNPHAGMHTYAIEWTPGIVRWFIDGELAYVQDAGYVAGLVYPMRIMMNLWAADSPPWVGVWDPATLPNQSHYDFVRYYAYTPGNGNAGTDDDFTLRWEETFDQFDSQRWEITEFGGFGGNFCTFISSNVTMAGGELQLSMTEPPATTYSLVEFSVDASSLGLLPGDVIYLNGSFNDWCGNCEAMTDSDGDGIWRRSRLLPSGNHEYLFTKNFWSEIGGAPIGSHCDFTPCDEYGNYGVSVPHDAGPITTPTVCWATCDSCAATDADGDGVVDSVDNCTLEINALQRDSDLDGHGNRCDGDFDQNCVVNFNDLAWMRLTFFSADPHADLDGDGVVSAIDLGIFKTLFFAAPGPSAPGALCDAGA